MIYTLLFLIPTTAADDAAAAALALAAAQRGRVTVAPANPAAAKLPSNYSETPKGWHEWNPAEPLLPGNHWHRDPITGLWKQHGQEHNGNADAHRAPGGNIVWEKASPPTQRFMRICENGRCRLVPIQ